MKSFLLIIFLLFTMPYLAGQEKKKIAYLDSIQSDLKHTLDSILKKTPNSLNSIVLKTILIEIAPKKAKVVEKGWKNKAKFSLLFNQSAFNYDWQGGGTSNIAGNSSLHYEINYKKEGLTWNNKIQADYGLSFLKNESFPRKTTDRIEFNSRLAKQIRKSFWNYSFFANFRSQFDKGYRFSKDPVTEETIRTEETHFFSPGFIQSGPGFLWKKNDDITVNIAPLTSRLIFVSDKFTSGIDYVSGDYFGVETGKNKRFEFGGSLTANTLFAITKNITLENNLSLYSNYIEDPFNIDIDYILNLTFVFNKYISGNFVFQAIYDDNSTSAFQIREVIGLGLNYTF